MRSILTKDTQNDAPDFMHVKLLDGAAVVHFLHTVSVAMFDQYADQVFLPYIMKQLENSRRVDTVLDRYIPTCIKELTTEKREKGTRRRVAGDKKLPGNWADFLHDPTNKQELFAFLSRKIANVIYPEEKEVITTSGDIAVLLETSQSLGPCDHEEADTRLLIHL